MSIKIVITSQYGVLSRGRHSARREENGQVLWAGKDKDGDIVITEPGVWHLHCSDGFRRTARAALKVSKKGGWEMTGDTSRFDVIQVKKAAKPA